MNLNLQCSICLKKNDYKSELQQYDCKFCLTKDLECNQDKLICKDCMKKINHDDTLKKCPFCNSSVKSGEKIDVYRTPTGEVVNKIIVKRRSCIRSCKNFLLKDVDKISCSDMCSIVIVTLRLLSFILGITILSFTSNLYICGQEDCYICYITSFLSILTAYGFFIKLFGILKEKYILVFKFIWSFLQSSIYTILIGVRKDCNFEVGILPLFIIYFVIFYYIINKTDLSNCD